MGRTAGSRIAACRRGGRDGLNGVHGGPAQLLLSGTLATRPPAALIIGVVPPPPSPPLIEAVQPPSPPLQSWKYVSASFLMAGEGGKPSTGAKAPPRR